MPSAVGKPVSFAKAFGERWEDMTDFGLVSPVFGNIFVDDEAGSEGIRTGTLSALKYLRHAYPGCGCRGKCRRGVRSRSRGKDVGEAERMNDVDVKGLKGTDVATNGINVDTAAKLGQAEVTGVHNNGIIAVSRPARVKGNG